METTTSTCSVCQSPFEVRFRYQVREKDGAFVYLCSQSCHQRSLESPTCLVRGRSFALEFPVQVDVGAREPRYYCTAACRSAAKAGVFRVGRAGQRVSEGPRRIAVFNHKGGTGKTTTAVNLAAGLAERDLRVLLIDADGQGNVGASLGIRGEHTLYHVLVHGMRADAASVPVRQNLDVLTSNE